MQLVGVSEGSMSYSHPMCTKSAHTKIAVHQKWLVRGISISIFTSHTSLMLVINPINFLGNMYPKLQTGTAHE